MTKSDEYFGAGRKVLPAESLEIAVPEISAITQLNITHNTNVAVLLINTVKTANMSAWKEPCDFTLNLYCSPRNLKGYLDNTLTCTSYPTGMFTVAGYTTGVVAPCTLSKKITLVAGKFGGVKRLLFEANRFKYKVMMQFTDVYGVVQYPIFFMDNRMQYIDLRTYRIDRSIALTMTVVVMDVTAAGTGQLEIGQVSTPNIFYYGAADPIKIMFDMYNSIDEMSLTNPPVIDESIADQVYKYLLNYQNFLSVDCKVYEIPVEFWLKTLAKAASFAIGQGWKVSTEYNNLEECKMLSLSLSGCMSKISSGLFSADITIPEHFVAAIENALASTSSNYGEILLAAALWAVADDVQIESGLN